MNAGQLWDTTMNPDFRTLRQVNIDNGSEADRIFSMLMGDEVPPRRAFIEKNAQAEKPFYVAWWPQWISFIADPENTQNDN